MTADSSPATAPSVHAGSGDGAGSESVLSRWARVVAERPDDTAFSAGGSSCTFREADEQSAVLARALRRRLGSDPAPVGVLVGHTTEAMTALLAAMRSGRPVVPLDGQRPLPWLRSVAEQTGLRTCLADADRTGLVEALGPQVTPVPLADLADGADLVEDGPTPPGADVPRDVRGGRDALCVVTTSGSSGRPKGAVLTHAMALADADAGRDRLGIGPGDRVGLVLPLTYTAGLTVLLFGALNGAGVWAYDLRERGVRGLPAWLSEQGVTTLHCTPHLLRSLLAVVEPGETLDSLRLVTTCGEAVLGRDVADLRRHLGPGAVFASWSGASEIGCLAFHPVGAGDPLPDGPLPVGRPVEDKDVQVLGEDGRPLPAGAPGEVVVTSPALADGYWDDDAATAQRFSVAVDGRVTFRTRDLGRLDDDGRLHLLGRLDDAVKVRGQLVEPAEVEAALRATGSLVDAAVVPVVAPPAATRLVAFVVPSADGPPESASAIRRRLRAALPDFMVPATVVHLSELPHTERGKVDRAALPAVPPRAASRPPGTQWEIAVAALWARALGLDGVDADEHFLELGGDSLAVVEVLALVEERLGVRLSTRDLVEAPTLAAFARRVALGAAALPAHPTAVTLRESGTRTPVFCFAPGGSSGTVFAHLASHLPDRAVHAFHARGLEQRERPDSSVEAASRRHLEVVRVLSPSGPYVLVGRGSGSLVALETAARLTAAGQEVALVVLVEPDAQALAPGEGRAARALAPLAGATTLAGLAPLPPGRRATLLAAVDAAAASRYRPRRHTGPAVVVTAAPRGRGRPVDGGPDQAGGLLAFLADAHVHRVPAAPGSLLHEPHAGLVARLLDDSLRRVHL